MEKCFIYVARNYLNEKVYIGYSSGSLKQRMYQHKYYAFTQNAKTKFAKALRKHGWENFTWEIIYESWDRVHCLEIIEDQFIAQYGSLNSGYNSMQGGFRGPILKGVANGMFGKTHTEEVKRAQGERAKLHFTGKTYEELYGSTKAQELRKHRSETSKGVNHKGVNNPHFKPEIINIKHTLGQTFSGNRSQIKDVCHIPKPYIVRIMNNKPYKGWSLA